MILIGDNLIEGLKSNNVFEVKSYGNITLEEYLNIYNETEINHDIIVYCFGYHDLIQDRTDEDIIRGYNNLKKGIQNTFIIIPPFEDIKVTLYDIKSSIYTFVNYYNVDDKINPNKDTIANLIIDLIEISMNIK